MSVLAALLSAAVVSAGRGKPHAHGDGFVRSLAFDHRLRVCNAYPYPEGLDVYRGKTEKLSGDEPMAYKSCRDFSTPLKAGDKLEFKVGDMNAGTFAISDLPNNDAVLMLVIHRHDTLSNAVSFESHVFANLLNAQMAIIDTYKGSAHAFPQIVDPDSLKGDLEGKGLERTEKLRYNSVVALNQGLYEVQLVSHSGEQEAATALVALDRESYVVSRTGVEAQQGKSYPQELVVFPQLDAALLKSSATRFCGVQMTLALVSLVAMRTLGQ